MPKGTSDDLDLRHNPAQSRYELLVDGQLVGRADYYLHEDRVVIPHTQVDPAHGGKGWGNRLVQFALDDVRSQGRSVVPSCPFVATFIRRNPDYQDLTAEVDNAVPDVD